MPSLLHLPYGFAGSKLREGDVIAAMRSTVELVLLELPGNNNSNSSYEYVCYIN